MRQRTRISKALSHCKPRQAPDSSTVSRSDVSMVPSATSYLRSARHRVALVTHQHRPVSPMHAGDLL